MSENKRYYRRSDRELESVSVKEAFDKLLDSYKLRGGYYLTYIPAQWERIMGPQIARRTSKIFVKEKTLYLKITSAPLKNELRLSQTKMIELLNRECGVEVLEDVVFL